MAAFAPSASLGLAEAIAFVPRFDDMAAVREAIEGRPVTNSVTHRLLRICYQCPVVANAVEVHRLEAGAVGIEPD